MQKPFATPFVVVLGVFDVFLVSYCATNTVLMVVGLLASLAGIIWVLGCRPAHIKAFVLFGVLGFLAESVPVYTGVWSYANPHIIGLPIWLPILWGVTVLTFIHIYERHLV